MNFADYQKAAKRTMNLPGGSTLGLDVPSQPALLNAALGLCGEAGEAAELVKKAAFHGKLWNREQAISELGDVLYYLAFYAECIGVSLDTIAYSNIQKLSLRFPNGWEPGGGIR